MAERTTEELVATLHEVGVETLVDVRRFPGSRRNPQFNQAALAAEEHPFEVAAVEDQQPVEALGANGAHEALGDSVRLRCSNRGCAGS